MLPQQKHSVDKYNKKKNMYISQKQLRECISYTVCSHQAENFSMRKMYYIFNVLFIGSLRPQT